MEKFKYKNKWLIIAGLILVILLFGYWIARFKFKQSSEENLNTINQPNQDEEIPITDSLIESVKNKAQTAGYFSDFYDRVATFPDFATYTKSGERYGKSETSSAANALADELATIEPGKIVNIMAPVRIYSPSGVEDVYVPLLSLKREGDNISLENIGNYWNIVQSNLNDLRSQNRSGQLSEVEKLLEKSGPSVNNDEKSFVTLDNTGKDVFSSTDGVAALSKILNDISYIFTNEIDAEKNNGSRAKEILLSDQLASLINSSLPSQITKQKIAEIISAVSRQSGSLFFETEEENNFFGTAEARCAKSGGSWFFETCNCPTGYELGADGSCASDDKLKNSCVKSGGSWEDTNNKNIPQTVCGGSSSIKNLDSDIPNSSYCSCPEDSCLGSDGSCNKNDDDSDNDGIANQADNCTASPNTSSGEAINRDEGSRYFGCGCNQIGTVMQNCPPNKCLGSHWIVYAKGEQECKDGKLMPYTCNFTDQGLSKFCVNPWQVNKSGRLANIPSLINANTGDRGSAATSDQSSFPINPNVNGNGPVPPSTSPEADNGSLAVVSPSNVSGKSGTSTVSGDSGTSTTGGKSHGGIIPGPAAKMPYLPRDQFDWSKVLPVVKSVSGQNGLGSGSSGSGKAEGITAALRRIYNQDYQTYKLIFTYLDTIKHKDGGGECNGCGKAKVDYKAPYKVLDQIIVHEAAHCAQDCTSGFAGFTRRELERTAVEKQIGSAHFEKQIATSKGNIWDLMEEFPSQRSQFVGYKGFEVRGYLARYWCKASPQGLGCGTNDKGFDLGDKSVFLEWLYNPAFFINWPIQPVYAYEPRSSKSGEYYYYGVEDGDANWGIIYATVSKQVPEPPDNTYGGYPYGFGKAVLGAKQKEEDVIRKFEVMSNQDLYPCKSSPPPDLPPAFGCEGAPTIQLEGD